MVVHDLRKTVSEVKILMTLPKLRVEEKQIVSCGVQSQWLSLLAAVKS